MRRPDFKEVTRLVQHLRDMDARFREMLEETSRIEKEAREACEALLMEQTSFRLSDFSVEELKNAKMSSQVTVLKDAGYQTFLDLYKAGDHELLAVKGIGEKSLRTIRIMTGEFLRSLIKRERIHFRTEKDAAVSHKAILKLAGYLRSEQVRRDAEPMEEELHVSVEEHIGRVKIRNAFHWVFSRRETRDDTVLGIASLVLLRGSPLCERAENLMSLFRSISWPDEDEALEDFRINSASYYAAAERLTEGGVSEAFLYDSIPLQLAEQIRSFQVNLSLFEGILRAYQEFGVQYILTQKKVLLGDEMGLGKTIQAIAAMAHLAAEEPGRHFLIVCPASVMINWCREIRKFSGIQAFLLHGTAREAALARWKKEGGAAVTSYESLFKFVDSVDRRMNLGLFVVDEAHYIKNPEAKRTRMIRRLYEESEHILLMTGTPLENKVEEMCELIQFIRPDLTEKIRNLAALRSIPEYKELLAPVYLRRRRNQVLQELPPLTEEEEWCELTPSDREAYAEQVSAENFMGMRRVSFLQEEMDTSSKARRLQELCGKICEEGRKAVVYSYFRETIRKIEGMLGSLCIGSLTGSTPVLKRQELIDTFSGKSGGGILICQIQAGGTGLNLQAASAVIFCEPQIKPSLTRQALSRVYRMGQLENVLVFHLLCEDTVDEAVRELLKGKEMEFDLFAEESALAEAEESLMDRDWIRNVMEKERQKYLPAVVPVSE